MPRTDVPRSVIEKFLEHKRIAMVGISREKHNIGISLMEEFSRHGYEVLPVNPHVSELAGRRCYTRVQDIQPAPEAALLLTSPTVTNRVVRDCADAGIRHIWMYRGGGQGAVSPEALEFCRERGIQVVPGLCPFMFLNPVHGIHRFHRFLFKITGQYPRAA